MAERVMVKTEYIKPDQHINIDITTVAEAHRDLGGSVYTMILEAAARARDIAKRRNFLDTKSEKLNYYGLKPINQALTDMVVDYNSPQGTNRRKGQVQIK